MKTYCHEIIHSLEPCPNNHFAIGAVGGNPLTAEIVVCLGIVGAYFNTFPARFDIVCACIDSILTSFVNSIHSFEIVSGFLNVCLSINGIYKNENEFSAKSSSPSRGGRCAVLFFSSKHIFLTKVM